MTIQKSLKYQIEEVGHGFPHRVHRSKKSRTYKKITSNEGKSVKYKEFLRKRGKII